MRRSCQVAYSCLLPASYCCSLLVVDSVLLFQVHFFLGAGGNVHELSEQAGKRAMVIDCSSLKARQPPECDSGLGQLNTCTGVPAARTNCTWAPSIKVSSPDESMCLRRLVRGRDIAKAMLNPEVLRQAYSPSSRFVLGIVLELRHQAIKSTLFSRLRCGSPISRSGTPMRITAGRWLAAHQLLL